MCAADDAPLAAVTCKLMEFLFTQARTWGILALKCFILHLWTTRYYTLPFNWPVWEQKGAFACSQVKLGFPGEGELSSPSLFTGNPMAHTTLLP